MLPAYRRIHLRVLITAPASENDAVAQSLRDALAPYGNATVYSDGPYYKDPADLEFGVRLEPHGRVAECVDALRALTAQGWSESPDSASWVAEAGQPRLLHPSLHWLSRSPEEAEALPRFESGDIVVIRDCAAAREHDVAGREAEVCGHSVPIPEDPVWGYAVRPAGWDEILCIDDTALEPTGRRAPPAEDAEPVTISVSSTGEITGSSSPAWLRRG